MEWQTIRSWREPGFWLPMACAVLLVSAIALGGNFWAQHSIEALRQMATTDPAAATAAAQRGLRLLGWVVCGFSLACAMLLGRYFQLGLRELRLPPSGWWSLGAHRVAVGPGAGTLSRFGLGLSALLAAAGVGCLFAVSHLLEILSG